MAGSKAYPFFACVYQRYTADGQENRSGERRNRGMSFERGITVMCRDYGEGVVINLPIHNKIAVKFPDGIVRYFWPEDVASGAIQIKPVKN